jgi:hypothetical protein
LKLIEAISKSTIQSDQQALLLAQIKAKKEAEGNPIFLKKYLDFIQKAANHWAIIFSLIPALSTLISKQVRSAKLSLT